MIIQDFADLEWSGIQTGFWSYLFGLVDCGLRTLAVSGLTAIDDRRLSEVYGPVEEKEENHCGLIRGFGAPEGCPSSTKKATSAPVFWLFPRWSSSVLS